MHTDGWIGQSAAFQALCQQLRDVAQSEGTVLLLGETGTGKSVAARVIHEQSRRRSKPFVYVNCGALHEGLIDSELFGHEKGAFTGALSRKLGKFEKAHGGTLFLDEIGDLPLAIQCRLLWVLQEGYIERVGGSEPLAVDVRVIAATHHDLAQAVRERRFRADLYFRLYELGVSLPALRERREDLPLLAAHVLGQVAACGQHSPTRLSAEALAILTAHPWPGNIRELEQVLRRAVVRAKGGEIQAAHIEWGPALVPGGVGAATMRGEETAFEEAAEPGEAPSSQTAACGRDGPAAHPDGRAMEEEKRTAGASLVAARNALLPAVAGRGRASEQSGVSSLPTPSLQELIADTATILTLEEFERRYLAQVLAHTAGVIHGHKGAARLLGMKPTTLRSRLEKLGLMKTKPRQARVRSTWS